MAGGNSGKIYSFKVVLLGEGCVGKTSLVLRYCEYKFNNKRITTLIGSLGTGSCLEPVLNKNWFSIPIPMYKCPPNTHTHLLTHRSASAPCMNYKALDSSAYFSDVS